MSRQDLTMGLLSVVVAGTQARVCPAGGSIHKDAPWRTGCCPGGKAFSCCLWKRAGCSFILGLLCFTSLSTTATRAKGSPRGGLSPLAGEGVQRFSDPAPVPRPCAPATCPAAARHGGRHCTGVTPAAQPVLPHWWWFSEVNPAASSSSSPLQAAAGERGPGWAAQGRLP